MGDVGHQCGFKYRLFVSKELRFMDIYLKLDTEIGHGRGNLACSLHIAETIPIFHIFFICKLVLYICQ